MSATQAPDARINPADKVGEGAFTIVYFGRSGTPMRLLLLFPLPAPRLPPPASYSADLDRLSKRRPRIFRRNELLSDVSGKPGRRDGEHHRSIIELLGIVDLVPARHSARMKVADVLDVVAHRANYITFHDLHVVDVV